MKQYTTFELCFRGPAPAGSEVCVDLSATFTCGENTKTVPGFYAGDGVYKVRFYPQGPGIYRWTVQSGLALEGPLAGEERCEPSGARGMVQANGLHFVCENGARFVPVGTTVYALCHQPEALIEQTIESLRNAPFNKVRHCVFPKHYDFNHNEPALFAFEKTDGKFDVDRPCYAFWDAFEKRILQLGEMGIETDLILFHPYDHWGFAELSQEECLTYLDYLTRRLAAIPCIWWSMANEYDLMEHFEPERWDVMANFVRAHDPYGHLLSNHHCIIPWDFTKENTTHCCIQGSDMINMPEYHAKYKKPVVFDECCYEGDLPFGWGNISAFELVHRFWTAYTLGGYCSHGETFWNEEEILWWAKGGTLRGESPRRIAFLRQVMEALPGDPAPAPDRMDRERIKKALENPAIAASIPTVVKCIAKMPDEQFRAFMAGNREVAGYCGDQAVLHYYGRHCIRWADITLPAGGVYDVEVLDVWEMTRKKVLTGVSGTVKVPMPGKEGMAILATKTE